MIRSLICSILRKEAGVRDAELEVPENEEFGDYSSNIAFQLFEKIKNQKLLPYQRGKVLPTKIKEAYLSSKSPKELAEVIASGIRNSRLKTRDFLDRVEVAGEGFINFWLSQEALIFVLKEVLKKKESFGRSEILRGKKYLLEHTSPNTIKTLHIGHVRNNVLGMALHNILESCGAQVKMDAINNDRGIHVMKAVWAYMKYGESKTPDDVGEKPDHFVDRFYVMGAEAYEKDKKAKEAIKELLRKWEAKDVKVRSVWRKLRDWTFEGFKQTYSRLGSSHDKQWFESEFYEHGKKMVAEGLKKGVFKRLPDKAVLSNLSKYGLSDTIVLRSDGTSVYHTQDLYLTKLKRETFPSDLYIWVIGPEQSLYLKQLFAMCEELGIGKREDYLHLSYGFVYLKGKGKMSSRLGTVVSADWLLEEVTKRARKIIEKSETGRGLSEKEKKDIAEKVGLAAIKYGFLKLARDTDLQFDIDESLSLEGNSGPYLQYTYARTQSVLRKFRELNPEHRMKPFDLGNYLGIRDSKLEINKEENNLLRTFVHFPEVVEDSAKNFAPNLICNYLYDLAKKYNNFYDTCKIIGSENEEFRLLLNQAVGQILKNGLSLLGIEALTKM